MSVHIRLARHGSKKSPYYRIVVADHRSPRDGRHIERLGTFNPVGNPVSFEINSERYKYWTSQGAKASPTLVQLIKQHASSES